MKKILIADDELRIRMLYDEVLSESGHEVHCAKNGAEAYELFKKHRPDLVIMDVKMPDMHGFEALEKIRQEDATVPVLVCSAYPKLGNDPTVITMGVAGFINKPIEISDLRRKVNEILGVPGQRAIAASRSKDHK
jgi:two-component system response regulator (stage 0 sporulation protein F)